MADTVKEIPPEKIVDREVEQGEFQKLVQFQDDARVLIIEDGQGTGKTTLLKRLQYNCQWVDYPPTPVSLVHLDDQTITTPFDLVLRIREGLPEDVVFAAFDPLNRARILQRPEPFDNPGQPAQGRVDLTDASLTGQGHLVAGHVGAVTQVQSAQQVIVTSHRVWSPELENLARRECIKAFLDDLRQIAGQTTVVVLLDSYDDRCNKELHAWIRNSLLAPMSFDIPKRPARFVVVLAGRKLPDFQAMLKENYEKLLRSRRSLGGWTEDHVRAFLELHGYGGLSDRDVTFVWDKVKEEGWSISNALKLADGLRALSESFAKAGGNG